MRLIEKLEKEAAESESMFRRVLAKEDVGRITKLRELARTAPSAEAYGKDGLFIGWTQGDFRTGDLKETLLPLMTAIYAFEHGEGSEEEVDAAWDAFHAHRLKVLLHCL